MQETINALSNQVHRLNDKLSQMQENDRSLIDMERLTRAEQRAEALRAQQVDVESKLADLQVKLEQIEYALKPENIERAAGYGTVHPEEARETRRRQLESEKARTQAQIRILETSRARSEETVEMIRKAGGTAEFMPVDVTRADQVQALVKKVVNTYGTSISPSTMPAFSSRALPPT